MHKKFRILRVYNNFRRENQATTKKNDESFSDYLFIYSFKTFEWKMVYREMQAGTCRLWYVSLCIVNF